jgi:RNA polymerase sigma-70 factor (ECF subfamily)
MGEGEAKPTGDAIAFERVFTEHYGFVCRTLQGMGVATDVADDLAQNVFMVVHRRLLEYDRVHDLRSWLWGIARRVLHTHRRTARRKERKLRALPEPIPEPGPDERVELERRAALVDAILAGLPDEQREVFVLLDVEGLSAPEAAEAIGIPLNTVYSRSRTARARFNRGVARMRARNRRRGDD